MLTFNNYSTWGGGLVGTRAEPSCLARIRSAFLVRRFNISPDNKCKEFYKLLSLYNKYKNLFVDGGKESFLQQLKYCF